MIATAFWFRLVALCLHLAGVILVVVFTVIYPPASEIPVKQRALARGYRFTYYFARAFMHFTVQSINMHNQNSLTHLNSAAIVLCISLVLLLVDHPWKSYGVYLAHPAASMVGVAYVRCRFANSNQLTLF